MIEWLTALIGTFATHHKQLLNFRHSLKRVLKLRPFVRAYAPVTTTIDRSINQSICRLISFAHSLHYNFEGREDSYSLFLSLSVCDRIYWIRLKNTLIRLDIGRHARQMQYIRRANSAVTVYHRNALNRSTRVFNRLPLYFSTKPHHHSVKVASLPLSLSLSRFSNSQTPPIENVQKERSMHFLECPTISLPQVWFLLDTAFSPWNISLSTYIIERGSCNTEEHECLELFILLIK